MLPSLESIVYGMAIAGVIVSACAGVLEAGRRPFDLFGIVVVALAAALGGGSLRDMLLDRTVFWIADPIYLVVAILAGVATFVLARHVRLPARLFLVPDAIGLALFTVTGTQAAIMMGAPWVVASLMGVITGVFGGILRDMLCNEVPIVFTSQLYATASWTGSLLLLGLHALGYPQDWSALAAFSCVLAVRLGAMHWNWKLPIFIART
jgi:uncharacterized membrane protein YeiH